MKLRDYQKRDLKENLETEKTKKHKEIEKISEIENLNKILQNTKTHSMQKSTKTKNIHANHRARLKKQFLEYGIEALSDVQKLELLLFFAIPQKDTNPTAHALLEKYGSVKEVLMAGFNELTEINGIKENAATLITLVNGLISYSSKPLPYEILSSTFATKNYCKKLYINVNVEQFYVLCLNKSNKIKNVKLMQSGTQDEINLQIRNITAFAIENKCNRIIVSHNHPAGPGKMSDEDCSFTFSLLCSCLLNSIEVIDHIIVGTDKTISLCEQNVMQKLKKKAMNSVQLPKEKQLMLSSLSENYKICLPDD